MTTKYLQVTVFKSLFMLHVGIPLSKGPNRSLQVANDMVLNRNENPDPQTTTPNGCKCKPDQYCGATLDGGNYGYDWCYTNEDCGEYSYVHGWWDKCLYRDSSKPDYSRLSWKDKHAQLWTSITADSSIGAFQPVTVVATESVLTTFDDEWDVMPAGRSKAIHGIAGICPFVVNIQDSPYSGILKTGETHGLIRMGSGNDFTKGDGMLPGSSVKFLRTGRTSANFVMINSFDPMPNGNHNFFSVPISNHLSETIYNPAVLKFCQATDCPEKLGISDICKYDQDGNEANPLVFPYRLWLEPADVSFPEKQPADGEAFVRLFDDIAVGTALYTLKANASPDDEEGLVLGQFVTTDRCVSSHFGDTRLSFRHQRIEEDKKLRPDWADAYDSGCTPLCF